MTRTTVKVQDLIEGDVLAAINSKVNAVEVTENGDYTIATIDLSPAGELWLPFNTWVQIDRVDLLPSLSELGSMIRDEMPSLSDPFDLDFGTTEILDVVFAHVQRESDRHQSISLFVTGIKALTEDRLVRIGKLLSELAGNDLYGWNGATTRERVSWAKGHMGRYHHFNLSRDERWPDQWTADTTDYSTSGVMDNLFVISVDDLP